MKEDKQFMTRALQLAENAYGRTSPNLMVGAVVVKDGTVVGEGWHKKAGTPHAEVNALADAGADAAGADIYVTLEPCSTHGKTPPCTEAIINAGIKRVFIGCLDPNPAHAGRAVAFLQEHGIEVVSGILEKKCHQLNEHFFQWITTGTPFVILKMAMTLDGKIATASGQSQWITSADSRSFVQKLRRLSDAIMVGGGTVRLDNPSLTVRDPENWESQPQRVILSRRTDFNSDLKIFAGQQPLFFNPETQSWSEMLRELGIRGVTCLLIEGGGEVAASALQAGVVNKVHFMIAPKILGGRDSRPVVGGDSPDSLDAALKLRKSFCTSIGQDFMITGYL